MLKLHEPHTVDIGDSTNFVLSSVTNGDTLGNAAIPRHSISRRTIMNYIAAAPFIAVSTVGAQASAPSDRVDISRRVADMAGEMSELLSQLDDGAWRLRVSPSFRGVANFSVEPTEVPPRLQLEKGLAIAVTAINSIQPGNWQVEYDAKAGVAMIANIGAPERDLAGVIEKHRAAWNALEAACPAADEMSPHFDPENGQEIWDACDQAEERAKREFLCFPAVTPRAQHLKASYLKEILSTGTVIPAEDFNCLIEAMQRA